MMATETSKNTQIKWIEKHLRSYKTYKVGLQTLKKQLDYIMPNMTASYDLSEGSSGTFNIKSTTEDYAIDRIESKKALMIHEDISRYKMLIDSIDDALKDLDEVEREFVEYRYIKRCTIPQTSIELGFSEDVIFRTRKHVMDKLMISLRGLIQF
ncbi:sigma-70 family RNA polymerase sigma factor [Virgibacillus sp. CBA3643]|uniref:sigma-70 family RNA polymerase sigma factor n=1 Tax=Virgibacillus sp. CBA3643 TaxID=2942278 RepID=UPI0035A393CE